MIKNEIFYHLLTGKEVIKKLSSNEAGLSKEEARLRLARYGFNALPDKEKTNIGLVFLKQFHSFFIYILIVAAIISFFVGKLIDSYVIVAVILINASIGFLQEHKAERAIAALKKILVPKAKVYREDELVEIPARELVPGDIILLEEGDRISADARLIEVKNFSSVEASLTGESLPVEKIISQVKESVSILDMKNMVWMGTFVANGRAKAIVTATGGNTVIGNIVKDIKKIKKEKSHFQKKTDILAIQMGLIAIFGAVVTFLIGFFIRGFDFVEILSFTMTSLVAGIPEGLPAILAIVLGIGALRMSKKNAIIRKLSATETLAVVDTIITDKTGTLTQNVMAVEKILLPGQNEISVSGYDWNPSGEFTQENSVISALEEHQLSKLLHIAAICNNSHVVEEENSEKKFKIIGEPTEAALLVMAKKAGLKEEIISSREKKLDDLPFNQELKYRASLSLLIREKKKETYIVGAPEAILKRASHVLKLKTAKKMTKFDRDEIIKQINKLTSKAMRVIALAYKDVPNSTNSLLEKDIDNLTYVGVVGMIDPPRKEVKEAIEKAKKAGIRVIMVTGDHKNTALAIAKEVGLVSYDKAVALTEEELKLLNDEQFDKAVRNVDVFARLTPQMKLKIADSLQKHGHIVAMTGDGVNDAPVLKKADIGISMGIIGTDVARESSEVILTDDNFASIINAIEEGRIVFTNTRQTSFFLITTNFAADLTIIATLLLGLPLPLLPTQVLWLNLVTDTCPAIGLAAEPNHNGIHEEKPKNPKENILTKEIIPFTILMVLTMVILTLLTFKFFFPQGVDKARTGAFVVMTFTQLFNSLNMRSLKKSLFKVGIFSNKGLTFLLGVSVLLLFLVIYLPGLQSIFKFASLNFIEMIVLIFLSSSVFWFGELAKRFMSSTYR